jgi:LytS/YehU family sensor histidine kinase
VRLSDLYRGMLDSLRRTSHSLAAELGLCRAYLDVEKARFGERLQIGIDVAGDVDAAALEVPVLVVQPLVENAVVHGISGRARGGRVAIRVRQAAKLEIAVEDDGVGVGRSTRRGAGTALANCRERLALEHGGAASLELRERPDGGTEALLRLPVVAASALESAP